MEALLQAGAVLLPKLAETLAKWLDPNADIPKLREETKEALEEAKKWSESVETQINRRDAATYDAIEEARRKAKDVPGEGE